MPMGVAEVAALTGAGWVASPIVSSLLKEGFSYLDKKGFSCLSCTSVKDRLDNLETTILPQFQLVIEAAEKSEHKLKLERWLRKLKDAMHQAEDQLDMYQYQLLEKKVHLLSHPTPELYMKCVGNVKIGLSRFSLKVELRKSLNNLEKIAAEAKTFRELLGVQSGNNGEQPNVTTSLPPLRVFGRKKDCDDLIDNYLLDSSEACQPETSTVRTNYVDVVAIVGIGGAGKTTLAQLIYNHQRVVDHFDIRMWVSVSQKLDVNRHMREMIESATMKECPQLSRKECPQFSSLEALQCTLRDLIRSKKVLLVLDDFCYHRSFSEAEDWKKLVDPLIIDGKRGSKILMTTRSDNVREVLHPENVVQLKDLEENEIVSLFMHHAIGGRNLDDQSHQTLLEDLTAIGKQIVQKLHRSPLAVKAVGGQLSQRLEVNMWRDALEKDKLSSTRQALLWSYQQLDASLQRCFSYFSMFPKGYRFEREKMVHLWMAEGFICSAEDGRRMEDIGKDYFAKLQSGCFLQPVEGYIDKTKYYNMHDLFHDLAEKISEGDYFRMDDDKVKEIPTTIRHLYVSGASVRENINFNKLKNLRTLIISGSLANGIIDHLTVAIKKCKKLRVLQLPLGRIKRFPEFVGDLKHLRYLFIFGLEMIELPVSLGKLYNLQLVRCPSAILTSSLKNLINLRYIEQRNGKSFGNIGRLTSLQNLSTFDVKEEEGYDIGQLKNLNELRGSLDIRNLENVKGKDEAIGANLKGKKHLESLWLEWNNHHEGDCRTTDLDKEVLEGLQPHPDLRNLTIKGYKSPGYPSWLLRIEKLRSLELNACTSLEYLPPMSKWFLHCDKLYIADLPNLRMFPLLPQSLKSLVIYGCHALVFVLQEELEKSDGQKKYIMTILQCCRRLRTNLEIMGDSEHYIRKELASDCLEVKRLMESEKLDVPENFQTLAATLQGEETSMQLDHLHLWEAYCCCQEQRLEAIFGRRKKSELILPSSLQSLEIGYCNITDGALSQSLGNLTSLKSLQLYSIRTITTLPSEEILHCLMALAYLQISDCHWLKSLGGLRALLSLKTLGISSCPCLELERLMPGDTGILPPSLQDIDISECMSMSCFVAGDLPNLVTLRLAKCRSLESLSLSCLTALTRLGIIDCPELSALDFSQGALGSLEVFKILNTPKLMLDSFSEANLSSLKELVISNSATLTRMLLPSLRSLQFSSSPEAFFHDDAFNSLTSLEALDLGECKVQSLPRSLRSLSSLKTLTLSNCPDISSLSSNLPESLEELCLSRCPKISSLFDLPASLRTLNLHFSPILPLPVHLPESLSNLQLWNCPGILSLPNLPQSLMRIEITGCPVLEKRCERPNGEDWPKIACIPQISIW